jgi:hypothetical protein
VLLPPKTVFNPPSVVVNSASPRSTQLVSPVDDTSRYFGLLSVLQDVIGPTTDEDGETLAPRPVDINDIFLQNSQADATMIGFSPHTSSTDISALVEESDIQDSSVMILARMIIKRLGMYIPCMRWVTRTEKKKGNRTLKRLERTSRNPFR